MSTWFACANLNIMAIESKIIIIIMAEMAVV